jgi:hypothetical protein
VTEAEPADTAGAGVVEEIYIAPAGGAPMQRLDAVEAVAREGLRGDGCRRDLPRRVPARA